MLRISQKNDENKDSDPLDENEFDKTRILTIHVIVNVQITINARPRFDPNIFYPRVGIILTKKLIILT